MENNEMETRKKPASFRANGELPRIMSKLRRVYASRFIVGYIINSLILFC